MARAVSFCELLTASEAVQTVIPSPIWAGVLGMERTMAECFNPWLSFLMLAPAMMDSTSAPGLIPFRFFITPVSRWGLTESTTTSACEAARLLSVKGWTPYFCLKLLDAFFSRSARQKILRRGQFLSQQAGDHRLRHRTGTDKGNLCFQHCFIL